MPRAPACLSCGTMCRTTFSSMIVLTATHSGSDRAEMVGFCRAGRIARTAWQVGRAARSSSGRPCPRRPSPLAASARGRRSSAASTGRRRPASLAMKRVVLCSSSATMRRLLARSELPVSVTSTMASARRGGLTSVAPQLNSTWAVDAVLRQPAPRQADDLGGDALALQILDALHRRVVRHGQHPAHRPAADLAEDQLGHFLHVGVVFQNPVVAGQAAVERAVLDVARHLLGADERTLNFRIVDGRDSSCGWRR